MVTLHSHEATVVTGSKEAMKRSDEVAARVLQDKQNVLTCHGVAAVTSVRVKNQHQHHHRHQHQE